MSRLEKNEHDPSKTWSDSGGTARGIDLALNTPAVLPFVLSVLSLFSSGTKPGVDDAQPRPALTF